MAKSKAKIAVCSRTFSKHPILKEELLEHFSDVKFNTAGQKLQGNQLIDFLQDREGIIIALEPLDANTLKNLPQLKIISKYGVGLNNIDQEYLQNNNIKLGWQGGLNARSVSELALTFAIGAARNILWSGHEMRQGHWKNFGGFQLSEKTVGVIGCGHVGKDFIRLLQPFNCKILVNDLIDVSSFCNEHQASIATKEEIYKNADIISLHIPLDSTTENLIDTKAMKSMKNTCILINTSRGGVVNEQDLYNALSSGEIGQAASDVFVEENTTDSPLLQLSNFYATPHIGGSSAEACLNMGRSAIQKLVEFFQLQEL